MLAPQEYFPCLCPLERDAIRLLYSSFVPTYFVVPTAPVDALYSASSSNFDGRQAAFENMFQVSREDVEIFPGFPEVNCYIGFYEYYLTWIVYDPIAYGIAPPECRILTYPG